jgi:elongation factor P--(R)-beta-lysine ligase
MTLNWGLSRKRDQLAARARIIGEIRRFFNAEGYLEMETPLRIPAPAPESHIDAISSADWFLQTSPELCMKRLLAAGFAKIFQICACWREGERGRFHLPEFTMLEWYRRDAGYFALMDECEALITSVAAALGHNECLRYHDLQISLLAPWERISVAEAFNRYTSCSMDVAIQSNLFDEIMVQEIEPKLGISKPVFIHDYPASRGALARLKQGNPTVSERFELYIGGVELANAFSELTDPSEQRSRFLIEQDTRHSQGKIVYPMPERFLAELHEMPEAAGIALGLDRLVMVLLNASSIDDVVAFTPEDL